MAPSQFNIKGRKGVGVESPLEIWCRKTATCKKREGPPEPLKNEMSATEMSVWLLLLYFVVGSGLYTNTFEAFSTLDSLYFMVVTMMTVGYGDLTPTNAGSRLFTLFWALAG
jgi:hypothetical protein